ncbi:helix-turn-helix domain-containing protein, partial [Kitasatospora paracochleata]
MSDELFDSVDALLAAVSSGLPLPAERRRLRLAAGLTPAQVAAALRVNSALVLGWEDGSAVPGPDIAPAYTRLLEGLAARFPAPEQQPAAPVAPQPQTHAQAPATAQHATDAPAVPVLDQNPDGSLLMAAAAPCVQCGQPSVYRAQGRPMHLGGFCRPATPATEPAVEATQQPTVAPAPAEQPPATPAPAAAPVASEPVRPAPTATPAPAGRTRPATARPAARPAAPRPAGPAAPAAASRWWPVVALGAVDGGWVLDVPQIPAPAGTKLGDWFAWLGTGLPLRVERAHPLGRGGDGTVCLTAAALKQLGLPAALPGTEKALTSLQAKMAKAAASVGMELSDHIGPAFHVFRRTGSAGGPKTSVRVTIAPWLGQGDARQQATSALAGPLATAPDGTKDGATFARRFRAFTTDLGVAPGATTASTAMLLLDAVRPRMEWVKDEATGEWSSHLRDGALPTGDLCVAPAAGARHPLTRELLSKGEAVCEEEDYKWWARELTEQESVRPWAVAVDVCASYLSVTDSLRLPIGPLEHARNPAWDGGKSGGLWWCDFTSTPVDELLPHPATFHGQPPTGPGWYATPTVAYMATTYGFDPATITDAYLSTHTVPLLKEWTGRIRGGYKRAYADLGLTDGQAPAEFLAAYAVHKDVGQDEVRADALVLAGLYKNIYKGGIGKWADSARHLDDET